MSTPNWNDLMPSFEQLLRMSEEDKDRVERAASQYVATLAFGVSGIGNLLACTASNGSTGLSDETATDIGWMLEAVGNLIGSLADTGAAAEQLKKPRE